MYLRFENREEAGQELSNALAQYKDKPDTIILALPRGGVPVAHEAAKILNLPMDVWLVRKLGVPGHEELAMGAIALNGTYHINKEIALSLNVPQRLLNQVIARERIELARRNKLYRQGRPIPEIKGKTIIIIDDGLATGATMRAAIESLRQMHAAKIVAAAPVGAKETCRALAEVADEVACLRMPEPFYGVGQWYRDFSQTSDEEVQKILEQSTESAA
ncbi:MAG: phosphoribosyltransferase [Micavibrio sp.]